MTQSAEQIADNRRRLSEEDKKLTYWGVIEPGLIHGVGFGIFLVGGYWVYIVFNDSLIGFLGVLMLLWAGLKALILLAIYGYAAFAVLFRPHWFSARVERHLMQRLKRRMDRDIETGQLVRAMDRAHGMLVRYPHHQALRRRLASLLIAEGRLVEAGRQLIYLPRLLDAEQQAVAAFCKANGHDPFQILRKSLKGMRLAGLSPWDERAVLMAALPPDHPLYEAAQRYDPDDFYTHWVDAPDGLPRSALKTMQGLHRGVTREHEQQSRLHRNLEVYFRYKDRSRLRAFVETNRGALIEIAIGIGLCAALLAIQWS